MESYYIKTTPMLFISRFSNVLFCAISIIQLDRFLRSGFRTKHNNWRIMGHQHLKNVSYLYRNHTVGWLGGLAVDLVGNQFITSWSDCRDLTINCVSEIENCCCCVMWFQKPAHTFITNIIYYACMCLCMCQQ